MSVTCHWAGGTCTGHELQRPVRRLEQLSYFEALKERLGALDDAGLTAAEIAARLNAEGWRPAKRCETFNAMMVHELLHRVGVPRQARRSPALRRARQDPAELTFQELAAGPGDADPDLVLLVAPRPADRSLWRRSAGSICGSSKPTRPRSSDCVRSASPHCVKAKTTTPPLHRRGLRRIMVQQSPPTSAFALLTDVRCHPSRPRSSIIWMWRSRWVGAVSAVSLGTAVDLGGMITAASGVCAATER